jgi:hypothetical protein
MPDRLRDRYPPAGRRLPTRSDGEVQLTVIVPGPGNVDIIESVGVYGIQLTKT